MKVVLIGGNPKGYDIPFHPNTLSGKRLRNMLKKHNLDYDIADMTANINDRPSFNELSNLHETYKDHKVVFLGRFVERELQSLFPDGEYLPHPASRRKQDLVTLENGLIHLKGDKVVQKSEDSGTPPHG